MLRGVICAAAIVLVSSSGASAGTIFFDGFSPQQAGWSFASPTADYLGPLHNTYNVGSVTLTLPGVTADPLGLLEFDLLIFETLDHDNCCMDPITMSVNGSTMFTGAFSGADFDPVVQGQVGNDKSHFFTNPSGATTVRLGPSSPGPFAAGTLNGLELNASYAWHFAVPIALLGGANTFTWSYVVGQPITSVDREAWGIDNVQIFSNVPEPGTLLLLGSALAATAARRKRARVTRS